MRASTAGLGFLVLCLLGACGSSINPLAEGETLPPEAPRTWDLSVHCGAGFLSYRINGTWWRTDEAGDETDWMPAEWPSAREVTGITVVLQVNEAGDELKVTYADHTVVYHPTEITDADLCA